MKLEVKWFLEIYSYILIVLFFLLLFLRLGCASLTLKIFQYEAH